MQGGRRMSLRISIILQKVFQDAIEDAVNRQHEFITPEHLLFASIANPKVLELFALCGSDLNYIYNILENYLQNSIPQKPENNTEKEEDKKEKYDPIHSAGLQSVFEAAAKHCIAAEKEYLGINDIFVSMIDENRNHCSFFMRKSGIDRLKLLQFSSTSEFYDTGDTKNSYVQEARSEEDINIFKAIEKEREKAQELENAQNQSGAQNGGASFGINNADRNSSIHASSSRHHTAPHEQKDNKKFLKKYTVDLIEQARRGELTPVIGREEEIERTIQILCRKQKNNPIHVGESGVGKTAITEGLAQKIIKGEVPSFLKNSKIYALRMSDLLAGAKFRGDFEERLKRLTVEIQKEKNAILFIDEIHTIMDANSGGGGGGLEAPDLLKPILSNGKLRCIGATTYDEYNKYFIKDKALARRFQKIDIEEPSESEAVKILKGLRQSYEDFHKVKYSDEVIEKAVHLSALHIKERFLPDKAIDLIDEAGSFLKIKLDKEKKEENTISEISLKDIDKIVAKMAKIPEQNISTDETEKLKCFKELISKKIFGQDEAVQGVCQAVKRSRAGFRSKDKPVANFLFVGPTGVGKTELAKTLAEELGIPLHRFDMSEYQEKHTVSRLIGSPPGYVGYEEGGLLTSAIRKQPNSVLLLDEIEKAHSDIYNILLQIMDYASLTDNQGRKASFSNVILIMTSNAGSANIGKPIIGFGDQRISQSAIDEAVEKTFSPEFRNRLDAIIKFGGLTIPAMSLIVKKEVEKIKQFLHEKELSLEFSEDVIELLAEKGYSAEFGARNAARLVEDEFVNPLTDMLLFDAPKKGSAIKCKIKNKEKRPYLMFNS